MKSTPWALNSYYLLALGISAPALASTLEFAHEHNILLASFDTELNRPSFQPQPPHTAPVTRKVTTPSVTKAKSQSMPVEPEASARTRLKLTMQLGSNGKSAEFEQAMTKLETLTSGNPSLTADIARVWIKQGKPEHAASFLEKNQPLNATATVLYCWALLDSHQNDKLTALLADIDTRKQSELVNVPRLQAQLMEIKNRHAVHQTLAAHRKENPPARPAVLTGQTRPVTKHSADALRRTAPDIDAVIRDDMEKAKLVQKISDLRNGAAMTYEMQDYKRSHAMLIELESLGVMDKDILTLRAWNEFNLQNYEESGKRFASLYQSAPDKQSAEGLFYSYSKLNRVDALRAMIQEATLSELLNKAQINTDTPQTSFVAEPDALADRRSNREKYDPFATLGISHADAYFSQRSKTGEIGTSRLITRKEPGLGYGWRSEDKSTDYRIQIDRITLNSGTLDPALSIVGTDGAYPLANCILPAIPAPQKNSMSGFEPLLIARHDTIGATYSGELGLTPTGGAIASTFIGRANALKYVSWGNIAIDAYIQPVRDSILSYSGMNDPYAVFAPWGRVTKTGVSPALSWQINSKWTLSTTAQLERLTGVNTQSNSHYGARTGIGYSFDVKKFDYINMDFSGSYDHYQTNQNLFTYGNGGYYSPQASVNIGPSVSFLTHNYYPLVIQGRAYAGYGHASNADALRYPLDPANAANIVAPGAGFYSGNSRGSSYGFSLQALWNVQNNLQLGGAIAYSQSNASAPAFK